MTPEGPTGPVPPNEPPPSGSLLRSSTDLDAIVAHRKANGGFESADQLAEVKGIGLATVEKNRDRIQVGAGAKKVP